MSGDSLELVDPWRGLPDTTGFVAPVAGERRLRPRTRLHWPVLLLRERQGSQNFESVTRDLSSSGFYCFTRVQLAVGEQLRCSLRIPTHDPRGKNLERTLECRVRVVRIVTQEPGDVFGVGCRIEDYHLGQAPPHEA
jgi:hypothetical protein